jgi:16S rRNA (cytosine1402-N4)-methyltransferase
VAVNDELGNLRRLLDATPEWLRPGGRLVILTFNSLEDRIVKNFLRSQSTPEVDRPEWPQPRPNPEYHFHLVVRKAISASAEEVGQNPRARSCKLRVAERIGTVIPS